MILYPPVKYDLNEWFFFATTFITWSLMVLLPKRIPSVTVVTLWVINFCLAMTADYTIGVKPYDLYDTCDRPEVEVFDILIYFFTYPPAAYFVIYIYSFFNWVKLRLAAYVLLCGYVTAFMEWGAVNWFHVFKYKGWSISYSGPVYVVVYLLNIYAYKLVLRYLPGTEPAQAPSKG
jgi:hypothetical protein